MNNWKEFERNTLRLISEQLADAGFEIAFNNDMDKNTQVLISGLPLLGEKKRQLNLEMCFLPIEEENRNKMSYNYLQFFIAIQNDIGDKEQKAQIELVNTLNATLPVGSFGVLTKDKLLFYRYCCVFTQTMTDKDIRSIVDANVSMIITVLNEYIDILCDVGEGRASGDGTISSKLDN